MVIMQLFLQVQQVLVQTLVMEGLYNGLKMGSVEGRLIRKEGIGRERRKIL